MKEGNIAVTIDRDTVNKKALVSIIIVVYNAIYTVRKSIESVIDQVGNYELILIDGGSTDGTLAILEEYKGKITHLVSEPDQGIYDAMNKGVKVARGEWVYFLGSDDILLPGILSTIKSFLIDTCAVIVFGNVEYDNGEIFKSNIGIKTIFQNTVHHQSAFYKRSLFDNFKFNTSFRILSDYELNLLIHIKKLPYKKIDHFIAKCTHGGSSFALQLSLDETNKIRKKYVNIIINYGLSQLLSVKYFISYVLLRKI
jgi:glycosyltransferase involved in cell wall biosynthesis